MGAFLVISDKEAEFDSVKAVSVLTEQCGTSPSYIKLPGWNLVLFPKMKSKYRNHMEEGPFAVYTTGSPYIFGKSFEESHQFLLKEIIKGKPASDILGLYFVLIKEYDKLSFITDPAGIYSIYHTESKTVLSSSFLALATGLRRLSLSKEALAENLLSGTIIGADTLFREIRRFEPGMPANFQNLEFIQHRQSCSNLVIPRSRKESLEIQIEALDNCFQGLKNISDENGIDAGITGGFDSRLLLAMCLRHFDKDKIQLHSHTRKVPDKDFISGLEICKNLDLKFVQIPSADISDTDESGALRLLESGMVFCDGQVRTHSFWHEDFNNAGYRISILGNKTLGLGGIGGEQYRNVERYFSTGWNFSKWVYTELLNKYCGVESASAEIRMEISERMAVKIAGRIPLDKNRIDIAGLKEYVSRVYIPSNRGLRGSYENRLSNFLFPLTDPLVSEAALKSATKLGLSLDYEAQLIKMINPILAGYGTSYNFSFVTGEPVRRVVPAILANNFLPNRLLTYFQEKRPGRKTDNWEKSLNRLRTFSECLEILLSLKLPIDIKNLVRRTDLGPLVFETGFLLQKFQDKLIL